MSARKRRTNRHRRCGRCLFERTYENATKGEADRWFGKHSCQKREDGWVRSAMHDAWLESIDRTPKPLTGKRQHGQYVSYRLDGCRCWPCTKAVSDYNANRERMIAYGRWVQWVDADPVRAHLYELREFGIGTRQISAMCGVGRSSLKKITSGWTDGRPPCARVHRHTAERIYSVEPCLDNLPDGANVPVHGATLRARALVAMGRSQAEIADQLGIQPGNATRLFKGEGHILMRHYRAIAALYDRWSMVLPPETTKQERSRVSRARRMAKEKGWLPPLALDDDRLDDPTYEPERPGRDLAPEFDHAKVERVVQGDRRGVGNLNHAEATEVVRRLRAQGLNEAAIEDRGFRPTRYPKEGDAS